MMIPKCSHINIYSTVSFATHSYEEICNAIGRSKRSVPEYVNELVNKRFIEVQNTMLILADGTHSNANYETRVMEETVKTKKPRKKREAQPTVEAAVTQDNSEDELPL